MVSSKATNKPLLEDAGSSLKLYETFLISRNCDLREQSLLRQNKGWFHISSMGHEGLATLARHFQGDDYFAPYYRDRALMLGIGVPVEEIARHFFAKRDSSSGGRQLPGHYSSRELRILSHGSPVGSHLLPACGMAWGLKLDQREGVVFASVGEAGSRQGDFYEAFCIAREHSLPVLFVVEDNRIAISTANAKSNPLALGVLDPDRWLRVDGSDVEALDAVGRDLLPKIRKGEGPFGLWIDTVRISSHSSADDQRLYLPKDELDSLESKDPVPALRRQLLESGAATEKELDDLEAKVKEDVRNAYKRAEKSPDPVAGEITAHLRGKAEPTEFPDLPGKAKRRMVDSINQTFHKILDENPDTVFFGQDIADPKGGVFKLTAGMSTKEPERVVNAPVAESTIVGLACGLAAYGKRPIFEIQFIDFLSPAWNQLVSNVANLRWRTFGDWECPAVIYAPCGAYLPGGAIWHSQSGEAPLASIPGLSIVMPSCPEDAAAVFWASLGMKDPLMVLIPKHSLWEEKPFEGTPAATQVGRARLLQTGTDLTVVSWGNTVDLVKEACSDLGMQGEVEHFDLLWLSPWDKTAVAESVLRTGRLLIVQEEVRSASVGQMIISELMEDPAIWQGLRTAPVLVSRDTVHIGFNPIYEYAALPDVATIRDTIARLLRRDTARPELRLDASPSAASPTVKGGKTEAPARRQVIRVPILGEGIAQARVVSLLKAPGDPIEPDDGLCEIETDKAVFPIESAHRGTMAEWLIKEDDEIKVSQVIAYMNLHEDEEASELEGQDKATENPPASSLVKSNADKAAGDSADKPAEPLSKDEGERERASGLSAEIIRQMQGLVPATITLKARWSSIREARAKAKSKLGPAAPSPSAMVAWCTLQAMKKHKAFTSTITLNRVRRSEDGFDLGIAVSLPHDELATAIVPQANDLTWDQFTQRFVEGISRARNRQFEPKTRVPLLISTMGPFDVRSAIPIVVPPSIATLFVGGAHFEPDPDGDGKLGREVVNLSLTFDHRWINGVGAASFLSEVRERLEAFQLPEL